MNLLFDTHAFLWWNSNLEYLSDEVLKICKDKRNLLILSTISVWEIQIKTKIGKLSLSVPIELMVEVNQQKYGMKILAVELHHVMSLNTFEVYHKDPFDRMLVAQAYTENLTLITRDSQLTQYSINTIW